MQIRFDRLDDVVKATELLPLGGFNMRYVRHENSCGTVGCMVGNYNAMTGRSDQLFGADDAEHFGMPKFEYLWIFAEGATWYELQMLKRFKLSTDWSRSHMLLCNVTREEALSRLKKYIAYKRRKYELIHDEKYGVRQEARTKEGNHNFVALAVAEVKAAMALATAT